MRPYTQVSEDMLEDARKLAAEYVALTKSMEDARPRGEMMADLLKAFDVQAAKRRRIAIVAECVEMSVLEMVVFCQAVAADTQQPALELTMLGNRLMNVMTGNNQYRS